MCFVAIVWIYLTRWLSIVDKEEGCQEARETACHTSGQGEASSAASVSSMEGQPPSARARISGFSPSWVNTTSVWSPLSMKSSVTTLLRPDAASPDQVKANFSGGTNCKYEPTIALPFSNSK